MRTAGKIIITGFFLAVGCSSEVDTVDGTGGNGGGTTAQTTSQTVGTTVAATTTSNTVASSTSSLMGTPCEQGCQHIENCTGFTCAQAGVNCSDPGADCLGACVVAASCADIIAAAQGNPPPALAACLQGCQGGQGGGGGGAQGCAQCVFDNGCADPCINDQTCIGGWGQCAQNCQDAQCFSDCNQQHPESSAIYTQVYACACTNCDMQCAANMDPCNQP